jgi:hypothetical protein
MRSNLFVMVGSVLFTIVASAQPATDRVLHFAAADSAQDEQEMATVLRYITGAPQVTVDPAQRTLTLQGIASQLDLAEWVFNDLDKPNLAGTHEYKVSPDDLVHVFYLTPGTVQELQELATTVRSTADIRRLYIYTARKAAVVRGSASDIAVGGWLFSRLDQPSNTQMAADNEYEMPGGDAVGVFYLTHSVPVPEFVELTVLIRTLTESKRAYSYSTPRAMAVRGTAAQIAFAAWLWKELDQGDGSQTSAQDVSPHDYRISGGGDDLARVLYLTHTPTVADFQKLVNDGRLSTHLRRICTYNGPRAVALRGTSNQVALATQVIAERYK